MRATEPSELECVVDDARAAALLDPLRARILILCREPASASRIAAALGLPRQRVNYHVQALAGSGLLRRAGRRPRRNMYEQLYVASARGYVLSPELLGEAGADWRQVSDPASAEYLLALSARMQADLSAAGRAARRERLPTLALKSQFRFGSPEERERFERELRDAVVAVIARFSKPNLKPDGSEAPGRPYRLVLGCYPYAGGP